MSSLRMLKKDIDFLVEELVSDCYVSLYFNTENREAVLAIITEAIEARNSLFQRANNPAEKDNTKLTKKHFAQVRRDMFSQVDGLFQKLSAINK